MDSRRQFSGVDGNADVPATVNIEGLVGGYTGQGGKTILPHRAVAKIDLRLVPDMTAAEALAALKAHLVKQGFDDIEVNMTGGYDPNSTSADAPIIKKQLALYKRAGIDPIVLPRSAGSWPGYASLARHSIFLRVDSVSDTATALTHRTNIS